MFSVLQDIYIRLMVWLGAAPPPGYEYLLPEEEREALKPKIEEPEPPPPEEPAPIIEEEPELPAPEEAAPIIEEEPELPAPEEAAPIIEREPELPAPEEAAPIIEREPELPAPEEAAPIIEEEPEPPAPVVEEEEGPEWLVSTPPPEEPATVEETMISEDLDWLFAPEVEAPAKPEPVEEEPEIIEEMPPEVIEEEAEEMAFRYTVQRGDTLSSIAKRYNLTVRELIEANEITDTTRFYPGQKLIIPGYMPAPAPVAAPEALPPAAPTIPPVETVRGVYASYFAIGHPESRQQLLRLLDSSGLNTVVIDSKGDYGWISYPTQVALAHEIGAARPTAKDFETVMAELKKREIYTIARLVVFKDNPLAKNHPEYAVKTTGRAEIWQDHEQLSWSDPFLQPVWEYNIQLAVEAAKMGFDEIQFHDLRFPPLSQAGAPQFSQEITKESRVTAITGFLSAARGQLAPLGARVAAATFGYTCWRKDDTLIGQDIDRMAQYLDVLCPMLYPSTFGSGIPNYKMAVAYPYEVVYESAKRAIDRVAETGCLVRPWIQDFPDYRFDKRTYGPDEIQAQIQGCLDAGCQGFMAWNPKAQYTEEAYTQLPK